jgi:hypothetical protein
MTVTRQQAMLGWVLGSAALMVLGAFGPWVKALGQSVSGTDGGNDGWIVVAAAVIAAALFYRLREVPAAGVWPLIGGVIGAIVTVYDRNNINDAIEEGGAFARALAQVGWGLNLAIVASISFAVAGAVWWRKHPEIYSDERMSTPVTRDTPERPATDTRPPRDSDATTATAPAAATQSAAMPAGPDEPPRGDGAATPESPSVTSEPRG